MVIEGAMTAWPGLTKWSDLNWLRNEHGHRTVPIELGRHADGSLKVAPKQSLNPKPELLLLLACTGRLVLRNFRTGVQAGEAHVDIRVCRCAPAAKPGKGVCKGGATSLSCATRGNAIPSARMSYRKHLPGDYFLIAEVMVKSLILLAKATQRYVLTISQLLDQIPQLLEDVRKPDYCEVCHIIFM